MSKDYYIVLGITPSADAKKIKKAYRTVAKKYHPDASGSPESAERFQEIREAYETLSDEGARRRYDEELAREGSSFRITKVPETIERRRSVFDEMGSVFSHVDDFFEGFLPGFYDRERRMEKDLYLEAILTPEEAASGGLFPVTVPVYPAVSLRLNRVMGKLPSRGWSFHLQDCLFLVGWEYSWWNGREVPLRYDAVLSIIHILHHYEQSANK